MDTDTGLVRPNIRISTQRYKLLNCGSGKIFLKFKLTFVMRHSDVFYCSIKCFKLKLGFAGMPAATPQIFPAVKTELWKMVRKLLP